MMKHASVIAAALVVGASAAGAFSTAQAHAGPKLLTTGSGERTAKTAGVSYEDIDGVHLFKGRARQSENDMAATLAGAPEGKATHVTIIHKAPWRSIRHLRTQGFYSGTAPSSRRFTQGFYSGN